MCDKTVLLIIVYRVVYVEDIRHSGANFVVEFRKLNFTKRCS